MKQPIKFFSLMKNTKKTGSQPDYRISFKKDDTFVQGGACWIKKDKSGNNFLSCRLADPWKDHTDESKSHKGYHIADDEEIMGFMGSVTPEIDQGEEEMEF